MEVYNELKCKFCEKNFIPISPNQVFCSKDCYLAFYKVYRARKFQLQKTRTVECSFCKTVFMPTKEHMLYCSDECKSKSIESKIKQREYEIQCPICNVKFTSKNKRAKFCSDKCRKQNHVVVVMNGQRKAKKEKEQIRLELLEKQKVEKRLEFNNLFLNYGDVVRADVGKRIYSLYMDHDQWVVSIDNGLMVYDCNKHSNIRFNKYTDALDFCYGIYSGDINYIVDYNEFLFKENKLKEIKERIKFVKFQIPLIIQYHEMYMHDTLLELIYDRMNKKLKYKVKLDQSEIKKILNSNSENIIDDLESYISEKVFNDKYIK